jgi:hypothetical protein
MGQTWTPEQAAALAPDDASLKAGRGLAGPRKWTMLGRDDDYLWGLCQGSGKDPYQVEVDLNEPAFKCSCPSRKFPCKHGLGLVLMFCEQPAALKVGPRPAWVEEWAAKRAEKAAKKEERTTKQAEAPPDPEAQVKRREKREVKIADGLNYLQSWLEDLMRNGLATAQTGGYEFWEEPAKRMVDAQAPGLARRLRNLAGVTNSGEGWERRVLFALGRLHLLAEAYRIREQFPPEMVETINAFTGWTVNQEELTQKPGVRDQWLPVAQTVEEEDRLITRITWLIGAKGHMGQYFQFIYAGKPVVDPFPLGRWFRAECVYFPGG